MAGPGWLRFFFKIVFVLGLFSVAVYVGMDMKAETLPARFNIKTLLPSPRAKTTSNLNGHASSSVPPSSIGEFSPVKSSIRCYDKDLRRRTEMRSGKYWVLYNHFSASKEFACDESITYTTHAEEGFLDNIGPLSVRWQGPISLAIYTPGNDYESAVNTIKYYRNCDKHSEIIRTYVTFHLFFPSDHMPKVLVDPDSSIDCSKVALKNESSPSYRKKKKLTYPINVARNIARQSSTTHYVFASDIELYPNPGLIPAFLDMINKGKDPSLQRLNPRVFVSSIFEIKAGHELPDTKSELLDLLKNQTVIPFHQFVCPRCHSIPKAKEWRTSVVTDEMSVFHVAKRTNPYHSWEPIYIGTNDEPLYDERLSWEGRSDKMVQGYQLCVLDYDFMILNNAFLIHRPGIKTTKNSKNDPKKVSGQNKLISSVIKPEILLLYGKRDGCVYH